MYLPIATYRDDLKIALRETVNICKLYHKSILITGAIGLIGFFAADMLLYANKTENEIYLLVRNEKRLKERFASSLNDERLHFVVQDVVSSLELNVGVDYIIHAAGDGFSAAFREHPVETMTPALFGTYLLLDYAKKNGLRKFLYVSSGEIYGKTREVGHAFAEKESGYLDSMSVRSCYTMAKSCAETLCVSFGNQYHIPIVVTRLSHTEGSCMSMNDNRVTVQFLNNAVTGKNIILHSAGKQMRSYTYVADGVSGLFTVLLIGAEGEAYNIANASSRVTIVGFANILARKAGVCCVVRSLNENEKKEHTSIDYVVLDSTKLEQLGWHGQYNIDAGTEKMYDIKMTERELSK